MIVDISVAVVISEPPDAPIITAFVDAFNIIIGDVDDWGLIAATTKLLGPSGRPTVGLIWL